MLIGSDNISSLHQSPNKKQFKTARFACETKVIEE